MLKKICFQTADMFPHLGVLRFGGELVPPLSLFIVEQHHSVHGADCEPAVVRSPGHAGYPGCALLHGHRKKTFNTQIKYGCLNQTTCGI